MTILRRVGDGCMRTRRDRCGGVEISGKKVAGREEKKKNRKVSVTPLRRSESVNEEVHQRCAFTVDVKECRMSDGGSAIGHATGVRAIVRGCDRANAQGAGKSVILADGNGLSRGLFGLALGLGAPLGPLNRVSRTGRGLNAAMA